MDIGLPGISGIEAATQIREYEKQKNKLPCIILGLTGNVEQENLTAYKQAGMNGCIQKGEILVDAMSEAMAQLESNPSSFATAVGGEKKKKDTSPKTASHIQHGSLRQHLPHLNPAPSALGDNVESIEDADVTAVTVRNVSKTTSPPTALQQQQQTGLGTTSGQQGSMVSSNTSQTGTAKTAESKLGLGSGQGSSKMMMNPSANVALSILARRGGGVKPGVGLPSLRGMDSARSSGTAPVENTGILTELKIPASSLNQSGSQTGSPTSPTNAGNVNPGATSPTNQSASMNNGQSSPNLTQQGLPQSPNSNSTGQNIVNQPGSTSPGSTAQTSGKTGGSSPPSPTGSRPPDLLLVEDVRVSQKIAQQALTRVGYKVEVASDGESAVKKFKKHLGSLKIVLMDIGLPGISGIEASQQIRSYEKTKNKGSVVIFGLTGNVDEENLHEYEAVGMNGCIMKGTLLAEAVTQALSLLQQNPSQFVNMCKKDALKKDDSGQDKKQRKKKSMSSPMASS
jgi:CheY-like chemotaxis protein